MKFAYNNSHYAFISVLSFYVNTEHHFNLNVNLTAVLIDISTARDWVETIKNIYISMKAQWKEVTEIQVNYYNKKAKHWEYTEEDYVWLMRKNIHSICFNKKLTTNIMIFTVY